MLQKSESGGKIEFAPKPYPNEEVINDHEQALVSGMREDTLTVDQDAGTRSVFNGSKALHCGIQVRNGQEQIMAIFSYSDAPRYIFKEDVRQNFIGRKHAIF